MNYNHQEQEYLLFERGIKPAIFLYGKKEGEEIIKAKELIQKGFSYSEEHFEHVPDAIGYFVFQDEKKKEKFDNSEKSTYDCGIALGFPPNACKYYQESVSQKIDKRSSIAVAYHGLFFGTLIDTLEEDISWLEKQYQIPDEIKQTIYLSVKYNRQKHFRKAEEIKNIKK